jgi:excisionase family DNA binding protein
MHQQFPRHAPSAATAAIHRVAVSPVRERCAPDDHPPPLPTVPGSGSVLDGDPRILIPLSEAAERLGISRWQAYKLARSGRLPTTRLGARDLHVPAAVLPASNKKASPRSRRGAWSREASRSARRACPLARQPGAE